MSEYASVIKEGLSGYGEEIQRFILDVFSECENSIRDGLMVELSKKEDESSAFNFLKSQGYEISYAEFEQYYEESKKIMNENEALLNRMMEEDSTSELSDDELENVAGGINWKAVGIGVGVGLIVGTLVAVTIICPVAAPATGPAVFGITTAGWGASAVVGATAAAATVGTAGAVGMGVAAGVVAGGTAGAIAAGGGSDPGGSAGSNPMSHKVY